MKKMREILFVCVFLLSTPSFGAAVASMGGPLNQDFTKAKSMLVQMNHDNEKLRILLVQAQELSTTNRQLGLVSLIVRFNEAFARQISLRVTNSKSSSADLKAFMSKFVCQKLPLLHKEARKLRGLAGVDDAASKISSMLEYCQMPGAYDSGEDVDVLRKELKGISIRVMSISNRAGL